MKTRSITRHLIGVVLLLEILATVSLTSVAIVHERVARFRAFDGTLRSHARDLLDFVHEASSGQLAMVQDAVLAPTGDLYSVVDEDDGHRVLGQSAGWPGWMHSVTPDPHGVRHVNVAGAPYDFVLVRGIRSADAGDTDGNGDSDVPHHLVIMYGGPTRPVRTEIVEAVQFYAVAGGLLLTITALTLMWQLRRSLSPLRALAKEAEKVSARQWTLSVPTKARCTEELTPLANALEATMERLENAFRRQERFTNDAAHELKTDVAIVKSSLQLLTMRHRTVEEYSRGLELAVRDCERVEKTVATMLLLAASEHEHLTESSNDVESVNVRACLADAMEKLTPNAALRNVELKLLPGAPAEQRALSAKQCDVLLTNLLENAIVHSAPGSVVRASIEADSEGLLLSIVDHGKGISADHLPYLFEPFYRADPSRDRHTGGSGLGLSVCKAICDKAEVKIEIISTPGRGTNVLVRVPVPR